ncbi:MAG: TOBE domain-containing protein [Alphaproteobacteria bacterium]
MHGINLEVADGEFVVFVGLSERIVIMKDGYIQQVGTPFDVYHKPANKFVAQFIGAPSMNMIAATVAEDGLQLSNGATVPMARNGVAEGQPVLLGIRPDDLVVDDTNPLIEGSVLVQEPLGAETLIYVTVGGTEVVAKASGREPPPVGSTVRLGASPESMHVFDIDSGEALV